MDSMIGHKTERYLSFGMTAAKLDDLMSFIPARLAGLILGIAAFLVPTAHPGHAIGTMLRDARNHSSPNAGWPEGAVAGALGLSLAGPRHYGGKVVKDKWIGNGRARLTVQDIHRALFLYAVACLVQGGDYRRSADDAAGCAGTAFAGGRNHPPHPWRTEGSVLRLRY